MSMCGYVWIRVDIAHSGKSVENRKVESSNVVSLITIQSEYFLHSSRAMEDELAHVALLACKRIEIEWRCEA